jgi:ATP-dependent DNA helicase PIF1
MRDAYVRGRLQRVLNELAQNGTRWLVCDEVSMMSAPMLEALYDALQDVNAYSTAKHPLGLILTGDFCQLMPVGDDDQPRTEEFAFEAECWPKFAANTTKLTKNWRQSHPAFLEWRW